MKNGALHTSTTDLIIIWIYSAFEEVFKALARWKRVIKGKILIANTHSFVTQKMFMKKFLFSN